MSFSIRAKIKTVSSVIVQAFLQYELLRPRLASPWRNLLVTLSVKALHFEDRCETDGLGVRWNWIEYDFNTFESQ